MVICSELRVAGTDDNEWTFASRCRIRESIDAVDEPVGGGGGCGT